MFSLQLWDVFVGVMLGLVLVNLYPKAAGIGGWIVNMARAAWGWVMTKVGRGSPPTIITLFAVMAIAALTLEACAKQYDADAYICGEPPNEVTFYCKPGTGPPRTDCGLPQTGKYAVIPMTC